ncbi:K(+) efflux antiporter 1, chloroplastic [Capsicum baccatum]|uniref:K(+) efflux antiporter 1, chloroplastic n=1 Tax=Capsicum baccatum TaxID=33114 RepID=A0A2G2VFJ0_CAPBA|nr:K(+) efflux antiporter 1, chloroplastic [Capsicum baccatum]
MVGLVANLVAGQDGPAVIVIGNGFALSYSAVVLQVFQECGKSTSRYGRATFFVLLFQVSFQAIAEALSLAAVKAVVDITTIIAGGRLLLRPIYKQIAENPNVKIFLANTLLVILRTSLLTARVGMSIDPKLLLSNFLVIMGSLGLLLVGKTILVALVHKLFGISTVSTIRVGLLLAPGEEFAFVAFGEAVNQPTDEASGSISPMDARRSGDDSDPNDSR